MSQSFQFTDILDADSRQTATRASFWRVRRREDERADWGLFVPIRRGSDRRGSTPDWSELRWEVQRHLPAGRSRLELNWRVTEETGDAGEWYASDVEFLPGVPRDILLEYAGGCEARSVVRADRGRDANVQLLDARGRSLRNLGRDRLGMVDTMELVGAHLRYELELDPSENLDFYLTGFADSWAVAMGHGDRETAREELHERLR